MNSKDALKMVADNMAKNKYEYTKMQCSFSPANEKGKRQQERLMTHAALELAKALLKH